MSETIENPFRVILREGAESFDTIDEAMEHVIPRSEVYSSSTYYVVKLLKVVRGGRVTAGDNATLGSTILLLNQE